MSPQSMVDRGRHTIVSAHGCKVPSRNGAGVSSTLSWGWCASRHFDCLTPPALSGNPPVDVLHAATPEPGAVPLGSEGSDIGLHTFLGLQLFGSELI